MAFGIGEEAAALQDVQQDTARGLAKGHMAAGGADVAPQSLDELDEGDVALPEVVEVQHDWDGLARGREGVSVKRFERTDADVALDG
jgi:hypothetical protein